MNMDTSGCWKSLLLDLGLPIPVVWLASLPWGIPCLLLPSAQIRGSLLFATLTWIGFFEIDFLFLIIDICLYTQGQGLEETSRGRWLLDPLELGL